MPKISVVRQVIILPAPVVESKQSSYLIKNLKEIGVDGVIYDRWLACGLS
jgi:hypothetical protein